MPFRSMLVAAAFALASLEAAHADGLRPIDGMSIDLGEVSGEHRQFPRDNDRRIVRETQATIESFKFDRQMLSNGHVDHSAS